MLLYGGCVSLCFTLSEYWIASATPEGRRGFVIGLYATLLSIGFAIGPAIIALLGTGSIAPFLIGSALMIAAAVPALLARGELARLPRAAEGALLHVRLRRAGRHDRRPRLRHGRERRLRLPAALGPASRLRAERLRAARLGDDARQRRGADPDRHAGGPLRSRGCSCSAARWSAPPGCWSPGWSPARSRRSWPCSSSGAARPRASTRSASRILASRYSGADLAGANAAFVFCYALGMLTGPLMIGDAMARAPLARPAAAPWRGLRDLCRSSWPRRCGSRAAQP